MHLARVHVRNFRNIRNMTVDFRPGLNVLLGENNVGKSNLLDAVRAALGAASTGDPVYLSKEDRHRGLGGTYVDEPTGPKSQKSQEGYHVSLETDNKACHRHIVQNWKDKEKESLLPVPPGKER